MNEPLLTVLLPVKHYHPPYFERAFASVLGQSSPHWRLLVVSEAAEGDDVRELMAGLLADERVRVVENEGRGHAGALNTGLRAATTEFAAVLLGDDMWAPEAVEVLSSQIERFPEVDFFYSARRHIDGDDRPISSIHQPKESFTLEDFVESSPVKHLLCMRRETVLSIGGLDETIGCAGPDDYDLPWSLAEAGARFRAVPECLYLQRDHRDSFRITTHAPRSEHVRTLRRMFRKHGVGRVRAELRIARAKRGYLRQCLYRSRFDRWLKTRLGHDARAGWRQPYE